MTKSKVLHWTVLFWVRFPSSVMYFVPSIIFEGLNWYWGSQMIQTMPGILSGKNIGLDITAARFFELGIILVGFALFLGRIHVLRHSNKGEKVLFWLVMLTMVLMDIFSNLIPFAVGDTQTKDVLAALLGLFGKAFHGDIVSIVRIVISVAFALAINILPIPLLKAGIFLWKVSPETKQNPVVDFKPVAAPVTQTVYPDNNTVVQPKYNRQTLHLILSKIQNLPAELLETTLNSIEMMASLSDQDAAISNIKTQYEEA